MKDWWRRNRRRRMDFLLGIHFLRRNISLPRLPPATVSTIDLDGDVWYFFASVSSADGTNNRAAVNERNWKREREGIGMRRRKEGVGYRLATLGRFLIPKLVTRKMAFLADDKPSPTDWMPGLQLFCKRRGSPRCLLRIGTCMFVRFHADFVCVSYSA